MTATHDSGDQLRYHSRGGLLVFGVWCLGIAAAGIGAGLNAAVYGEPPWFLVAGIPALLAFAIHSTSLEVILASNGELTFRGLLRRQTLRVSELRNVRPAGRAIVFRFEKGGAMVVSSNTADWLNLCQRLKRLNPDATLNMPGMFRLPPEPESDREP